MFFTLGAELSMTPMDKEIGTKMAGIPHISLILFLCFTLGFLITVSEPDLQVLAEQVPTIPNHILILAVAGGVGLFLVVAMLRMLFSQSLAVLLFLSYSIVFVLTYFIPQDFTTVVFDSGGVASGPMTVTFLLPFAMGACQALGGNIYCTGCFWNCCYGSHDPSDCHSDPGGSIPAEVQTRDGQSGGSCGVFLAGNQYCGASDGGRVGGVKLDLRK